MRSTNRVLTGNLAAASANASLAPSTSNRMRPGLTRVTHSSGVPFPEPMRTSSGFFDTGTSGNIRIQTRPERFMWRVSARRLDLPRGDALRLDRLQPILTERKVDGAGGDAMYAPLVRLAEFGSHRLQHELRPSRLRHLRSITPRPGAAGRPRLRPCAYPAPSDRAP